jgi:hypothetical protein
MSDKYNQIKQTWKIKSILNEAANDWKQSYGCYPTIAEFEQIINGFLDHDLFQINESADEQFISDKLINVYTHKIVVLMEDMTDAEIAQKMREQQTKSQAKQNEPRPGGVDWFAEKEKIKQERNKTIELEPLDIEPSEKKPKVAVPERAPNVVFEPSNVVKPSEVESPKVKSGALRNLGALGGQFGTETFVRTAASGMNLPNPVTQALAVGSGSAAYDAIRGQNRNKTVGSAVLAGGVSGLATAAGAPQWASSLAGYGAQTVANSSKTVEKVAEKGLAKLGLGTAAKVGAKAVPVLGAAAALGFAADRANAGDYVGAGGEVLSGVLHATGVGSPLGSAVDVGLAARDILGDQMKKDEEKKLNIHTDAVRRGVLPRQAGTSKMESFHDTSKRIWLGEGAMDLIKFGIKVAEEIAPKILPSAVKTAAQIADEAAAALTAKELLIAKTAAQGKNISLATKGSKASNSGMGVAGEEASAGLKSDAVRRAENELAAKSTEKSAQSTETISPKVPVENDLGTNIIQWAMNKWYGGQNVEEMQKTIAAQQAKQTADRLAAEKIKHDSEMTPAKTTVTPVEDTSMEDAESAKLRGMRERVREKLKDVAAPAPTPAPTAEPEEKSAPEPEEEKKPEPEEKSAPEPEEEKKPEPEEKDEDRPIYPSITPPVLIPIPPIPPIRPKPPENTPVDPDKKRPPVGFGDSAGEASPDSSVKDETAPTERYSASVARAERDKNTSKFTNYISTVNESRSGTLNTKSAVQNRAKKQQYKVVVVQDGKKLEIFAKSIQGIRRAVFGKKSYRVYDGKGSDITNYFKRLMASKKSA